MGGSVNRVILVGNVGKDPEIRSTQGGTQVANLSLATSESWRDKSSGEKREKTQWHAVVIWGPLVKVVESYVKKGSKLYVEGALQTRKWQDQQGNDRYTTEVVLQGYGCNLTLLDAKGGGSRSPGDDGDAYQDDRDMSYEKASAMKSGGYDKPMDDEIPF